jgi:C_GCAxxG_C_C family probable redox protein
VDRKAVETRAFAYFQSGFHCAETVSGTTIALFAKETSTEVPRVASAFGGGIGRTYEDVCGALAGGTIAIGYLFGRMTPGENIDTARALAAELRRRFIERFGSTNCRTLLAGFGEQENWARCKSMTAEIAGILAEMLVEAGLESRQEPKDPSHTGSGS